MARKIVLNLPMIVIVGGVALAYNQREILFPDPSTAQACNRECNPMWKAIHVDRAVNTTLRDDTLGGPTLTGAYNYVKTQYQKEARTNPGVLLVGHAVA